LENGEIKLYELRDDLIYQKINKNKLLFYVGSNGKQRYDIRTCHDDIGHIEASKVIANIIKIYLIFRYASESEKLKNKKLS